LDIFSVSEESRIDFCGNSRFILSALLFESVKKATLMIAQGKEGIKQRYLFEIAKENLQYCKDLIKIGCDLRHSDDIEANFALNEKESLGSIILNEMQQQAIYSNVKEIVQQQQSIFENLWNKSVPAIEKIREIEEGIEPEFLTVVTDYIKAQNLYLELANSIQKEALFLLADSKAMLRAERLGVVEYLIKASSERGATIRIICPLTEENSKVIQKISNSGPSIKILDGGCSHSGILLVDDARFLRFELKEPRADQFAQAIGSVVYSNSKISIDSTRSFFELLWNERILNEQLKTNEKIQKEFINIASHEIRTPTQAIIALSDLLQTHPEKRDEIIQGIKRNAIRLQRLTNDILDVTRIESQTLQLNKELFNLNELISNILEDYKNQVNNTMVQLIFKNIKMENGSSSIFVEGDKYRLSQVICNILDNAIRFTKEGTISISTKKRIKGGGDEVITENSDKQKQEEQEAVVTLEDTGTGIHSEILSRLFSKFATKSNIGGTGLGLFISKSIVEAHGGRIRGENYTYDGKKGARFIFTIPLNNHSSSTNMK
jgi:two-component system, OmpR family, sensor histidine kinase VicK